MRLPRIIAVAICFAVVLAPASAQDTSYYEIRLADLELTEGEFPGPDESRFHSNWERMPYMEPRVSLDGPPGGAQAYLAAPSEQTRFRREALREYRLCVRAAKGERVTGVLVIPKSDYSEMVVTKFSIDPDDAADVRHDNDAETAFHEARRDYYEGLQSRNLPGTAWFRFRASDARAVLGQDARNNQPRRPGRDFDDAFALFTGGRAVAENLQLDRFLPQIAPGARTVSIDTIEGITIEEYDWTELVAGAKPTLDTLAAAIPFDQHAVFFPSFGEFMNVLDELEDGDLPIFELTTPRPEDARTLERYERQLALPRGALARMLGPSFVRSVALTGSDPYFPSGTDVAILFEPVSAEMLHDILHAQIQASARSNPDAKPEQGKINGVAYKGYRSPDRAICSYVATLGETIVVTNSTAQLDRLASVMQGETDALASLEEYHFFRNRYSLDQSDDAEKESGFLMLSDATIRRWSGPRWRIGTARRMVASSLLADATARMIESGGDGVVFVPGSQQMNLGTIRRTSHGVSSSAYGSLEFMTPIAEMSLDTATEAEAQAYERWRDGYQRNWRWAFDPVALRFSVEDDRLATDLSVMPLIVGSRYRYWLDISEGATITNADPHDTLAHFATSINTEAPLMQNYAGMATGMLRLQFNPLDWIGQTLSVYADPDPIWEKLADAGEDGAQDVITEAGFAIPVAIYVESKSVVKLTAFLAAVRGFMEQTSPETTVWEPRKHNGRGYVRVGIAEAAKSGEDFDEISVFYAVMPRALIVSMHENVLQRAIDREVARSDGERNADQNAVATAEPSPWLGENLALNLSRDGWRTFLGIFSDQFEQRMQLRAWDNIAILNEWKRLHPDTDPVRFHLDQFRVRLVDPAGGQYVWNDRFRTMESSVYGHPGQPQDGPALAERLRSLGDGRLGVTFENDGLRARTELQRSGG